MATKYLKHKGNQYLDKANESGRGACRRRRDSESGRMRFRNYEDGTSDGGFLMGSVSDNGSRIKCGMTERGCGTTKRGDSESGRSMVEMLGTLAIMGVLAIGGVAGYRWAMDKYRANDTIKELTQRALVYGQQMNQGTELSSAEFNPQNTTSLGYALAPSLVNGHPDYFQIALSGVPKRVCQNIVNDDWLLPVALSVNGVDDEGEGVTCTEEENNAMILIFHKDLSGETLPEQSGGNEEPEVSSGNPESIYSFGEPESPSLSDTETESTVSDSNSPYTDSGSYWPEESWSRSNGGQICYENNCYSCEYPDHLYSWPKDICHQCTNRFYTPGYDIGCWYCGDENTPSSTEDSECSRCPQREMMGYDKCVLKRNCGSGAFNTAGGCMPCSYDKEKLISNKKECHTCTGDQKRFITKYGDCYSCSYSYVIYDVDAGECEDACKDSGYEREINSSGYCVLKNCDGFITKYGDCYSCSHSSYVYYVDADECGRCDAASGYEREMIGNYCVLKSKNANCTLTQFKTKDGCQECSSTSNHATNADYCHGCPDGQKRFMSNNGSCYACSYSSIAWNVDANECARCKDTSTPRYMSESGCYKCPTKTSITTESRCTECNGVWNGSSCS